MSEEPLDPFSSGDGGVDVLTEGDGIASESRRAGGLAPKDRPPALVTLDGDPVRATCFALGFRSGSVAARAADTVREPAGAAPAPSLSPPECLPYPLQSLNLLPLLV
jgi:hypothetical protein